ncbi:MAG: hypothetical protein O2968_21560, partial [Acidobacteria bacterium]|nr:hypothetical protein [Acidobacteriota bacterium]
RPASSKLGKRIVETDEPTAVRRAFLPVTGPPVQVVPVKSAPCESENPACRGSGYRVDRTDGRSNGLVRPIRRRQHPKGDVLIDEAGKLTVGERVAYIGSSSDCWGR